jgi:signal transduction histidine kinase
VTKPVDFPVALARIRTQMLRKRAEEALRESESKNRAMLRAIPDALFRLKRDGTLLDFKGNDSFALPFSGEAIGKKIEMMLPSDIGIPIAKTVSDTLQQEAVQIRELETAQDGQECDFEIRVVVSGSDEVLVLIRDITERKKVERLRNEFISILSHDLRSSLTSIRGALSLIEMRTSDELPGHVKALVNIAHKNSDRLVRLINDLLDLERMEGGKLQLQQQEVELKPLIQKTIDEWSTSDKQKANFILREESVPATVLADPERIAQVVNSLLMNAARFSPEDEPIDVLIKETANQFVRVSVTDRGPTIPEAFRNRIFQKVSQSTSMDTQQEDESGLGLSISKAIIEKLNGRIGFEAREGGGNTFYFELQDLRASVVLQS